MPRGGRKKQDPEPEPPYEPPYEPPHTPPPEPEVATPRPPVSSVVVLDDREMEAARRSLLPAEQQRRTLGQNVRERRTRNVKGRGGEYLRKFPDGMYKAHSAHWTRAEANREVRELKRQRQNARVTKERTKGKKYYVWVQV